MVPFLFFFLFPDTLWRAVGGGIDESLMSVFPKKHIDKYNTKHKHNH